MPDFYSIPLAANNPDQRVTTNFKGMAFSVRVYFAPRSCLWWLELGSADRSVTLSHIILRPGVMTRLQGRFPGCSGSLAIGMVRLRDGAEYSNINAFDGNFGLYLSDGSDAVTQSHT